MLICRAVLADSLLVCRLFLAPTDGKALLLGLVLDCITN